MIREFIQSWLVQMGVKRLATSSEGFTGQCCFHDDSHPSFTINGETGQWICWSARCPYRSGNLSQLLVYGLGYSVSRARSLTASLPQTVDLDKLPKLSWETRHQKKKLEPMREALLGFYSGCPKYLLNRGFSKKILRQFEVGYDPTTDRAIIPNRDLDGTLVGISKRSCSEQTPKWIHENFSRGSILFNAHRSRWDRTSLPFRKAHGILVEGQLDCIWLEQCGYQNVVSTLSAVVTETQVQLLSRVFSGVTIFFDHDEAGLKGAYYLAKRLSPRVPTWVASLYENRTDEEKVDPSRLSTEKIEQVLSRKQPASDFILETCVMIEALTKRNRTLFKSNFLNIHSI